MASPAVSPERATYRTVTMLRPSEKQELDRLALQEKVSTAEVIRRLIQHGEALLKRNQEEQLVEAALKIISTSVAEANESMTRTMDKLDRLHLELAKRDIA